MLVCWPYSFKNGRALTAIKGKFGFIDKKGKVIIPHKYGMLREFVCGTAGANIGLTFSDAGGHEYINTYGHWGVIDSTGKIVIPIKYDHEIIFNDNGISKVCVKNKWGFINRKGKEIISIRYDEADDFIDGKAKVKIGEKEYFIDINGNEIE